MNERGKRISWCTKNTEHVNEGEVRDPEEEKGTPPKVTPPKDNLPKDKPKRAPNVKPLVEPARKLGYGRRFARNKSRKPSCTLQ